MERHACPIASIALAVGCSINGVSYGGVVKTQIEERAFFSLWLLSDFIQQCLAHDQVQKDHEVFAIPEFTSEAIADADVVYVSPAIDELQLTVDEIDALEQFVLDGGRLIIPADNSIWAVEFAELAARFGVTYGDGFVDGVFEAEVLEPTNPLFDGPFGMVESFSGASVNNDLATTNPDVEIIAGWDRALSSLAYLRAGAGEVVFLSDFNTFDTDMWFDHDNSVLWRNLFVAFPMECAADLDGSGAVGFSDLLLLLDAWNTADAIADLDDSGVVGFADLLLLLDAWSDCV